MRMLFVCKDLMGGQFVSPPVWSGLALKAPFLYRHIHIPLGTYLGTLSRTQSNRWRGDSGREVSDHDEVNGKKHRRVLVGGGGKLRATQLCFLKRDELSAIELLQQNRR